MRISVKVQPRSSKNEVVKSADGTFKVYLTKAPTDGKANKALIDILAEYFKIKKSEIKIVSGKTSKNKIIEIASLCSQ